MQNVLKRKNMYLEGFLVILHLFPQIHRRVYHSESIDMHINKNDKKAPFGVRIILQLFFLRLT